MKDVKFRCDSCQHKNKVHLGEKGFELITTDYDSLTDVLVHLKDNPSHYVVAFVEPDYEEE